ncbi:MAG TPA: FtsX-like permease family protein [Chitinophagaceae bacterium]|jgi:hypothetical protein|nr:FtsX-like permease family protein [Chitinophagaceae bacterium]
MGSRHGDAYAKQHNIQLNTIRLDERLSEQDLLLARAARYPNLSGSATQSLTHSSNTNPVVSGFQTQANLAGNYSLNSIVISITGGIIGVMLGLLASKLITVFLSWPTLVSESSIVLSFVVCAITGIFFGYYPAQKASRLDPIEALRYE